jgi:PAS domain S-box-containing protein
MADESGPMNARALTAQENPDLYRLLIEAVRDYAIFALDETGHVLTWNPGAQRFKGYTAEEIIGQHFSVFYPEEDRRAGKTEFELMMAEADGRFEDEGWRVRKDGTQFWANVVITALRNREGKLIGFAKVTRDLTERRNAELRAISDARRVAEAEAANRAKSEFLATMSHELRTPLNAIGGYVDLLSLGIRGPVTEQQQEDLERIRRSQQHLLGIINDLLNFSRLEAGRVAYDLREVQVRDVVEAVRAMVETQANRKELTMVWPEIPDTVVVRADKQKLEQILVNLLTNAVKFTLPDGRIEIKCESTPAVVKLAVIDNGIGIPSEKLAAIFEPFVQVGRTLSSVQEGAGLGLAISRELALAMGGDLQVHSRLEEGSTFTLSLPASGSSVAGA